MDPIDHDTCATIFRMLDDYVDRELDEVDLARVERHLLSCAVCASEFRFEDRVLRNVRAKVQRIAVPPDLQARIWKRVVARARPGNLRRAAGIRTGDSGEKG